MQEDQYVLEADLDKDEIVIPMDDGLCGEQLLSVGFSGTVLATHVACLRGHVCGVDVCIDVPCFVSPVKNVCLLATCLLATCDSVYRHVDIFMFAGISYRLLYISGHSQMFLLQNAFWLKYLEKIHALFDISVTCGAMTGLPTQT